MAPQLSRRKETDGWSEVRSSPIPQPQHKPSGLGHLMQPSSSPTNISSFNSSTARRAIPSTEPRVQVTMTNTPRSGDSAVKPSSFTETSNTTPSLRHTASSIEQSALSQSTIAQTQLLARRSRAPRDHHETWQDDWKKFAIIWEGRVQNRRDRRWRLKSFPEIALASFPEATRDAVKGAFHRGVRRMAKRLRYRHDRKMRAQDLAKEMELVLGDRRPYLKELVMEQEAKAVESQQGLEAQGDIVEASSQPVQDDDNRAESFQDVYSDVQPNENEFSIADSRSTIISDDPGPSKTYARSSTSAVSGQQTIQTFFQPKLSLRPDPYPDRDPRDKRPAESGYLPPIRRRPAVAISHDMIEDSSLPEPDSQVIINSTPYEDELSDDFSMNVLDADVFDEALQLSELKASYTVDAVPAQREQASAKSCAQYHKGFGDSVRRSNGLVTVGSKGENSRGKATDDHPTIFVLSSSPPRHGQHQRRSSQPCGSSSYPRHSPCSGTGSGAQDDRYIKQIQALPTPRATSPAAKTSEFHEPKRHWLTMDEIDTGGRSPLESTERVSAEMRAMWTGLYRTVQTLQSELNQLKDGMEHYSEQRAAVIKRHHDNEELECTASSWEAKRRRFTRRRAISPIQPTEESPASRAIKRRSSERVPSPLMDKSSNPQRNQLTDPARQLWREVEMPKSQNRITAQPYDGFEEQEPNHTASCESSSRPRCLEVTPYVSSSELEGLSGHRVVMGFERFADWFRMLFPAE